MPAIRNSADLQNKFDEILEFCKKNKEPVFLTNDGQGELAVMSIDVYEELVGKIELYHALQMGLDQIKNGEVVEEEEMMRILSNYIGK